MLCHASAWDIDNKDDLRIKMCIKVNSDDFVTIHHELGHNYYQRAYKDAAFLYRNGANDGFHEAIGDFVALSITPEYLVQIGLLDQAKVPSADKDTGLLLRQAMDKVAFLPFGLLVDKWRWSVFSGEIKPDGYQAGWDALRLQYQGIDAAGRARRDALRCRRQISCRRQRTLHALLPRAAAPVPVLQGGVRAGRLEGAAASLLVLRQQGSRRAAEQDARDGRSPSPGPTRCKRSPAAARFRASR